MCATCRWRLRSSLGAAAALARSLARSLSTHAEFRCRLRTSLQLSIRAELHCRLRTSLHSICAEFRCGLRTSLRQRSDASLTRRGRRRRRRRRRGLRQLRRRRSTTATRGSCGVTAFSWSSTWRPPRPAMGFFSLLRGSSWSASVRGLPGRPSVRHPDATETAGRFTLFLPSSAALSRD